MDTNNPQLSQALRSIPSVDALLRRDALAALPRSMALRESRLFLDSVRRDVMSGSIGQKELAAMFGSGSFGEGSCEETVLQMCEAAESLRHRRVINATGIVLHTGIGRASLAKSAREAIADACGYAVVELNAATGLRNQREERVQELFCELTGAEGALVVNNNAAMVNLVLRALAEDREVVVSRGELVEIGGGFRLPDVMVQAGCRMVEVGTTNRTHLRDYQRVIRPETEMLLKIHPSNFRVEGFQKSVDLADLVELGRARDVLVFEDLGSGLMVDRSIVGLEDEPRVSTSLAAGVPLVSFSGDKLFGGPQCGVLLGDRELVARVRAHPLYRAFRCDKLTLAGLEATLLIYRNADPCIEIPTLRAIARSSAELESLAADLCRRLEAVPSSIVPRSVVSSESFVGSGANPARPLASFALALQGGGEVAQSLRTGPGTAIISRVTDGKVLLDMRTLADEDFDELSDLIAAKFSSKSNS